MSSVCFRRNFPNNWLLVDSLNNVLMEQKLAVEDNFLKTEEGHKNGKILYHNGMYLHAHSDKTRQE